MEGSWFPIFDEQLENPHFQKLSHTRKVLYWYLASELNRHQTLIRSDIKIAAALKVAEITVRKARERFVKVGCLKYEPGGRGKDGFYRANTYTASDLKWSLCEDGPYRLFFSKMNRFTFYSMLHYLRKGTLTFEEVVVFIILRHEWWRAVHAGRDHQFVSKMRLREVTKRANIEKCIRTLNEQIHAFDGGQLIEIEDHGC